MLYQLNMADGGIVSVSMAGVGLQGDLWIHAHGLTVAECARIFSDPQKTNRMYIVYDETISDTFEGYTELFSISTCDDFVRVGIGKGAENA